MMWIVCAVAEQTLSSRTGKMCLRSIRPMNSMAEAEEKEPRAFSQDELRGHPPKAKSVFELLRPPGQR